MNPNHIFSLIVVAIGALCFVVFITTLKPPLHDSEMAVGSIYGRGMQNYLRNGAPRHLAGQPVGGQPAVDNSHKVRLQRIKDECEETYGVNSSQSVDCFFTTLAKRMAAEAAERTGSHPATRQVVRETTKPVTGGRRRHGPRDGLVT